LCDRIGDRRKRRVTDHPEHLLGGHRADDCRAVGHTGGHVARQQGAQIGLELEGALRQ
jgi:hypothetical protein